MDEQGTGLKDDYEVVLHGVSLPMETSLKWLTLNGHYADTLLHLCIRKRQEEEAIISES
jgi:hypothetical protein